MFKYKNKTDQDIDLIGVGTVKAGEEFSSVTELRNPAIELVGSDDQHAQGVVGTEAPQPNAVINAQPVAPVINPVGPAPTQGGTN